MESFTMECGKAIGMRVNEIRKSKCITAEELAEQLGLSVSYIGLIERGVKWR